MEGHEDTSIDYERGVDNIFGRVVSGILALNQYLAILLPEFDFTGCADDAFRGTW